MHRLFAPSVILLVACASSASAEPPAPAAPKPGPAAPAPTAPAACKPSGAAVFQIDHKVEPGAKLATSAVKLYATGACA